MFLAGASIHAYDPVTRLMKAIGEFETGASQVSVTLSAGWAVLEHDLTIEDSIRRADDARYKAKAGGRNQSRRWREAAGASRDAAAGGMSG